MLSLELWTKNSQGERTYQGTYRPYLEDHAWA